MIKVEIGKAIFTVNTVDEAAHLYTTIVGKENSQPQVERGLSAAGGINSLNIHKSYSTQGLSDSGIHELNDFFKKLSHYLGYELDGSAMAGVLETSGSTGVGPKLARLKRLYESGYGLSAKRWDEMIVSRKKQDGTTVWKIDDVPQS